MKTSTLLLITALASSWFCIGICVWCNGQKDDLLAASNARSERYRQQFLDCNNDYYTVCAQRDSVLNYCQKIQNYYADKMRQFNFEIDRHNNMNRYINKITTYKIPR